MNVRLKFNTDLRTGSWFVNDFVINTHVINIQLITKSHTPKDHPVCMGRIRTVMDLLENTIFINQDNTEKIAELSACGFKVVAFPQEPIDQIVGIVLFKKLNAVLEGRMQVTDLDICSDAGDNIWFMHSANELVGAVADTGWWNDPGPVVEHSQPAAPGKKVVKLRRPTAWDSFDLEWNSGSTAETVIINIKDDK